MSASNDLQRVADYVQVAQAQQVHLQQTHVFHCPHFKLGDDRGFVWLFAAGRFALDRHVVGDRLFSEHNGCGMDAVLAAKPLNAFGCVYDLAGFFVLFVHSTQIASLAEAGFIALFFLKAGMQRGVAA